MSTPRDDVARFLSFLAESMIESENDKKKCFQSSLYLLDSLVATLCESNQADRYAWFVIENLPSIAAACFLMTLKTGKIATRHKNVCQVVGRATLAVFGQRPKLDKLQKAIRKVMGSK
jgi:hypothetical protein